MTLLDLGTRACPAVWCFLARLSVGCVSPNTIAKSEPRRPLVGNGTGPRGELQEKGVVLFVSFSPRFVHEALQREESPLHALARRGWSSDMFSCPPRDVLVYVCSSVVFCVFFARWVRERGKEERWVAADGSASGWLCRPSFGFCLKSFSRPCHPPSPDVSTCCCVACCCLLNPAARSSTCVSPFKGEG